MFYSNGIASQEQLIQVFQSQVAPLLRKVNGITNLNPIYNRTEQRIDIEFDPKKLLPGDEVTLYPCAPKGRTWLTNLPQDFGEVGNPAYDKQMNVIVEFDTDRIEVGARIIFIFQNLLRPEELSGLKHPFVRGVGEMSWCLAGRG